MLKQPRHPDVRVRLVGQDGNAYAIMARVARALKRAGVSREEIDEFRLQCTSSDYDNLLRTVMAWVSFDNEHEDYGRFD